MLCFWESSPDLRITISVVDQIKNNSCFDRNVSVADCLEKVTLNRSDVVKSVILGWSRRQEVVVDRKKYA